MASMAVGIRCSETESPFLIARTVTEKVWRCTIEVCDRGTGRPACPERREPEYRRVE